MESKQDKIYVKIFDFFTH